LLNPLQILKCVHPLRQITGRKLLQQEEQEEEMGTIGKGSSFLSREPNKAHGF